MGNYPIFFTHNSSLLTRELQLKVEDFRYSPYCMEGLRLIWAPMGPVCLLWAGAASFRLGPPTARGVQSKARAAESEILLQPSNEFGCKVHFTRGWDGVDGDQTPFRGCSRHTNTRRLRRAEGSLLALVPGQRWPRCDNMLAAAWTSPEPSVSCPCQTLARAMQGAALQPCRGRNGLKRSSPGLWGRFISHLPTTAGTSQAAISRAHRHGGRGCPYCPAPRWV